MYNCNRVALIGNIGQDPELRTTRDGTSYVRLHLATHEQWKDQAGEVKQRAEWHAVTFWGKLAETASKHLKKGSYVSVEGVLRSHTYKDEGGVDRRVWEVRATNLGFLDRRGKERPEVPSLTASDSGALSDEPATSPGLEVG
jgi:single-strand DNA-binding protein